MVYDSLTFASELEYRTIKNALTNPEEDAIGLFSVIDNEVGSTELNAFRQQWNKVLDEIVDDKFNRKSPEKKVKEIYKRLHENLLVKYELHNKYPEIYKNGFYNCVSATAMYAMALEACDIPYQIKEAPTHVYLVAYPDQENILIESTDPQNGYITFDPVFKRKYVENLSAAKLISQQELRGSNTEDLFRTHYFGNENIDLNALAGIQYANNALLLLEEGDIELSFYQLEKAFLLYPSDRYRLLLVGLAVDILHQTAPDDLLTAYYYAKIARYSENEVTIDEMAGEFMRISQAYLTESYQPDELETWMAFQEEHLTWPELLERIRYLHEFESGRMAYNRGNFNDAVRHFGEALRYEPENIDIQNNMIAGIEQQLVRISSVKQAIDTLRVYGEKYDQLISNVNFRTMLVSRYLFQFAISYDLNRPEEAESYRQHFEKAMTPDLLVDREAIGRAYSLAAIYYFKKGYSSRARQLIDKGLSYAPDNYELLVRKNSLR